MFFSIKGISAWKQFGPLAFFVLVAVQETWTFVAFSHRSQIPLPCLQVSGFRVIEVQSTWELSRCAKASYMERHRVFALSNDSPKPEPTLLHCPFCEGPCQIQADDVSGGLFHLGGSGKHLERHFEMVRKFLQTSKPRQCECPLLLLSPWFL